MKTLVDYIGKPALLEQTAEECIELAHACLKLARHMRGENKVHGRTEEELVDSFHEEYADVIICMNELEFKAKMVDQDSVEKWVDYKKKRMKKRFREADKDE